MLLNSVVSGPSLTSRVLDRIGRLLIGSPDHWLGEGFGTFYWSPGERRIEAMTDIRLLRASIGANVFRRLLFTRVAIVASITSFVLCAAGLVALGIVNGIGDTARRWSAEASASPPASLFAECAALLASPAPAALTPEQAAAIRARCAR